jgi:PIN domain nuclease of toxin-antitoxin system
MTPPLLDTHTWIWWVDGNTRLSPRTLKRLDGFPADRRPRLSAISLWEAATLVSLGRLELRASFDAWIGRATASTTVEILPITAEIAVEVARLPEAFRRDPADRVIVATARVHQLAVATADRVIQDSKLVRIWRP